MHAKIYMGVCVRGALYTCGAGGSVARVGHRYADSVSRTRGNGAPQAAIATDGVATIECSKASSRPLPSSSGWGSGWNAPYSCWYRMDAGEGEDPPLMQAHAQASSAWMG